MSDKALEGVAMDTKTLKVPAALRTIQVLQALGKAGSPMTAQALSTRLGIPRSSVYQLLEVLEAEGFVVHFPEEKRWSLGVAAFELGSAYLRHDPLERFAAPLLNRLLSQLGGLGSGFSAVAQLGVLQGAELLYLMKGSTLANPQAALVAAGDVGVVTDVGVRLPAHLTASGRSMLSLLPKSQLRAIFPGGPETKLPKRTESGPGLIRDLERILKSDKERGYSLEMAEVSNGFGSVAAAAVNHLGLPVAAFAVTFRTERIPEGDFDVFRDAIATLAIAAGRELSKRLGAK